MKKKGKWEEQNEKIEEREETLYKEKKKHDNITVLTL